VSARALGDGLLTLVLAENLRRAGRAATLYHTQLTELATWFPKATIQPLPDGDALAALLARTDAWFVGDPALVGEEAPAIRGGQQLVFTKQHWLRSAPFLQSLEREARRTFRLETWTDENGIAPPPEAARAQHARRVCLHPTSGSENKNWPADRFVALAERLRQEGYEPVFLLAEQDVAVWRDRVGDAVPCIAPGSLDLVAAYLRASGAAITTDSGIGHLASNVGLPTLTLFRKRSAARFWAPCWGRVHTVTASLRLPGAAGHRHWGRLLSVGRVRAAFQRLMTVG
jgi:hypothetical protein